jgi:hypothetical protein
MWYLILATCVAGADGKAMTCTEAEVMSEHLSLTFCETEMQKYADSKIAVLCMERDSVAIVQQH